MTKLWVLIYGFILLNR